MQNAIHWSAVNTQPNKEALAASHIEKQGYRVYFPAVSKRVRHARRVFDRTVSFFPSYIFVQLDHHQHQWTPINGTIGVRSLVMAGTKPATLPPLFVEQLGSYLSAGKQGVAKQFAPIEPGTPVRIAAGPFQNMLGQFETMTETGRVRVLLELLGGKVPVELDRELLTISL
jgi:transcriptional antiterminator RfaH